MIKRVFVGRNNEVLGIIMGGGVEVQANTPAFSSFYDLTAETVVNIGDYFENEKLINLHPNENKSLTFDYNSKTWLDLRSLDEVKNQRWAEIRKQRDALEFGGFEFEGDVYDSDQVSQGRILGAATSGVDQIWTLADNTTKYLTAEKLKQLYTSLQIYITQTHERARIARQLIRDATTHEQLEQIQL